MTKNATKKLTMSEPDLRLEVQLYAGVSRDDPHMMPLATRRIDFGKIVQSGTPIDLTVDFNDNRDGDFEFKTIIDEVEHVREVRGVRFNNYDGEYRQCIIYELESKLINEQTQPIIKL